MPAKLTPALQLAFLQTAYAAAKQSGHCWPDIAACEAALESGWGQSELASKYNSVFGQKQSKKVPLPYGQVDLLTGEVIDGHAATVRDSFVVFPDFVTCFKERMALLQRLPKYYAPALAAKTGEEFVREVSGYWDPLSASIERRLNVQVGEREEGSTIGRVYHARWSTDPNRAAKVMAIRNDPRWREVWG